MADQLAMNIKHMMTIGRRALLQIRRYSLVFVLDDNILNYLRKKSAELEMARTRLQKDGSKRQDKEVGEYVRTWLIKADELLNEVQHLENEIKETRRRFNWFPYRSQQHRLGKEVEKNILSIAELQETFDLLQMDLRNINLFSSWDFVPSRSSLRVMKRIREFLAGDSMRIFVLFGKRGVGKASLMKDVGMKARVFKAFDVIVTIVVTQEALEIKHIQDQIAESLELVFEEGAEVEDRARKLWCRLKQKRKFLLILIDVLEEPNWTKIGIPCRKDHKGCKILLTTRTLPVSFILNPRSTLAQLNGFTDEEACDLFRKNAGLTSDTAQEIKEVANRIAKECQGLPMVIITLGRALRGKPLDKWKYALRELQNSKEVGAVYHYLKLSYELLQSDDNLQKDDTRQCFLLCSLFPEYYEIDVEDVVRYAFGLRLFQGVSTIEDARARIYAAIKNLRASLFLLDYGDRNVKMPKMIRDAALLITSKEEDSFMIRSEFGLKEWPRNEILAPYLADSLMATQMKDLSEGFTSEKLRILLLEGESCKRVSTTFLERLKALQVFSLHDGVLSMDKLQHMTDLRALHLKECELNYDISSLGMLKNLETLSLCRTNINELPKEIRELSELKSLDLSDCEQLQKIHPGLIPKLFKLEELYLGGKTFQGWDPEETSENRSNASLSELNSLNNLAVLSLEVRSSQIPRDFVFPKLHKYYIGINEHERSEYYYPTSRTLRISASSINAFEKLFQNVQYLHFSSITGCQNLLSSLDQGALNELTSLELRLCQDMECIIDATNQPVSAIAFSKLEKLVIEDMLSLKELCKGQPLESSLPNLQMLTVTKCANMTSAVPVVQSLKEVRLRDCSKLPAVFQVNKNIENHRPLFSNLAHLELTELQELKCIWDGPCQNVTFPVLKVLELKNCSGLTSLFSQSLAQSLEQLETLRINGCCALEQILTKMEDSSHLNPPCLPRLATLEVADCSLLEYIFPITAAEVFPSLRVLDISKSLQLKQVFLIPNDIEGDKINLPQLQWLALNSLTNLSSFCPGKVLIEVPSLQELKVEECPLLTPFTIPLKEAKQFRLKELRLSKLGNPNNPSSALEFGETSQSYAECIRVGNFQVIFGLQGGYFLSSLENLILEDLSELRFLWASKDLQIITLQNLTRLELIDCKKLVKIFSFALARNLPQLSSIMIHGCDELDQIVRPEILGTSSTSKAPTECIYFPNLIKVRVENCNKLKCIFPVHVACLPRLEEMVIKGDPKLEQIFELESESSKNDKKQMVLPKLKVLILEDLPSLISFSPVGYHFKLPFLDTLVVKKCMKMVTSFTCQEKFLMHTSDKSVHAETEESSLPEEHKLSRTMTVQKLNTAVGKKCIEWHRDEQK
ncbi:hypothetical protein REPUB_Repub05bG0041900 [Reevesia pubescens]